MKLETEHILIGMVILILIFYTMSNKEGYRPNTFCGNCHTNYSKEECMNCPNCGYCEDDQGVGTCLPGDPASPYFNDKCMKWKQRDTDNILAMNDGRNPYNCGYVYPYETRVRKHQRFATGGPWMIK
jgi:hypothetical protein